MAVYKIFPEKDAFISSKYPAQNTGRDEILEVSNTNAINLDTSAQGDVPAVKRALIQFKTTDISDVITNKVGASAFTSSLKLYLANADIAPLDYTIEAYPGIWEQVDQQILLKQPMVFLGGGEANQVLMLGLLLEVTGIQVQPLLLKILTILVLKTFQ
jgi:hypothetical protein